MKLEFYRQIFGKKAQVSNFIEIRLVGAELLHAGGRTDRQTDAQGDLMKLIVAFRNFANVLKRV